MVEISVDKVMQDFYRQQYFNQAGLPVAESQAFVACKWNGLGTPDGEPQENSRNIVGISGPR